MKNSHEKLHTAGTGRKKKYKQKSTKKIMHTWKTANYKMPHTLFMFGPSLSPKYISKRECSMKAEQAN